MTRPSTRRPRRRVAQQDTRRVIRVLTEGEITEPEYLTAWTRYNRRHVRLDISDRGMTPKTLVSRAREHVRKNRPMKRRAPDYDEIWCVFDIDEHPDVPQAIEEARQGGIEIAVSNPCFELWLVLHAQAQTAHIERQPAQRLFRRSGAHTQQGDSSSRSEQAHRRLRDCEAARDRPQGAPRRQRFPTAGEPEYGRLASRGQPSDHPVTATKPCLSRDAVPVRSTSARDAGRAPSSCRRPGLRPPPAGPRPT